MWRTLPASSLGAREGQAAAVAVAMMGVALLVALGSGRAFQRGLEPGLFLLAHVFVFTDALDLFLRLALRRRGREADGRALETSAPLDVGRFTPRQVELHLRPWALVASVHNAEDELDDFLEGLGRHRRRLWVIDDASTDRTCFKLEQAGVSFVRGGENRKKPGALRALLAALPPEIETVVVLDPDITLPEDEPGGPSSLERVLFEFQRSGAAAASPRLAIRPDGWLGRLQELEYAASFGLGRMSLGEHSITSGVAVYRRDALQRLLERHSLSVYAEDLENAILLLDAGERVYYDPRLVIQTEGKRTWREWFSQRVGWHYGLVKVYAARLEQVWRGSAGSAALRYQYVVYMGLLTFPLHPFKLAAAGVLGLSTLNGLDLLLGLEVVPDVAAADPAYFLYAYAKYTALALVVASVVEVSRAERLRLLPAVPVYVFYTMAQTVPATVGYLNWCSLRLTGGRLYRDHYQDEASLRRGRRPEES